MDSCRGEPMAERSGAAPSRFGAGGLSYHLAALRQKLERDLPLTLALDIGNREAAAALAPELIAAIQTILQQAVLSAADQGGATLVKAAIHIGQSSVLLRIDSNGAGFPFKGSYDLADLLALGAGPQALAQLVAVYRGWMRVSTAGESSRIDITVPLEAGRHHGVAAE